MAVPSSVAVPEVACPSDGKAAVDSSACCRCRDGGACKRERKGASCKHGPRLLLNRESCWADWHIVLQDARCTKKSSQDFVVIVRIMYGVMILRIAILTHPMQLTS